VSKRRICWVVWGCLVNDGGCGMGRAWCEIIFGG
jgi:hypothetical protein